MAKETMNHYQVVECEGKNLSGVMDIEALRYYYEECSAVSEDSVMDSEYTFAEALSKCKPPTFEKQPNNNYHVVWYIIARYSDLLSDGSICGYTDWEKMWLVNDQLEPEEI